MTIFRMHAHKGISYIGLDDCGEARGCGEGYFISHEGAILSLKGKKPKVLKCSVSRDGFLQTNFIDDNKHCVNVKIHRLLYSMFVLDGAPIPQQNEQGERLVLVHLDGNRLNNTLNNLKLVTMNESLHFFMSKEEITERRRVGIKNSKKLCKHVKVYDYDTKQLIGEYNTITEASQELGFAQNNVSKHVAGNVNYPYIGTKRSILPKRKFIIEIVEESE